MLVPPIIYISVSGAVQVLTSIGVILLAFSYCQNNRSVWRRIFLTLLTLSFALNFAIATQTSMNTTFYN